MLLLLYVQGGSKSTRTLFGFFFHHDFSAFTRLYVDNCGQVLLETFLSIYFGRNILNSNSLVTALIIRRIAKIIEKLQHNWLQRAEVKYQEIFFFIDHSRRLLQINEFLKSHHCELHLPRISIVNNYSYLSIKH